MIGPVAAGLAHDHHHRGVEHRDVGDAHAARPDEAAEQKLPAAERPDDQRLQQAALGVAAYRAEGQEHRQHGRQKQ